MEMTTPKRIINDNQFEWGMTAVVAAEMTLETEKIKIQLSPWISGVWSWNKAQNHSPDQTNKLSNQQVCTTVNLADFPQEWTWRKLVSNNNSTPVCCSFKTGCKKSLLSPGGSAGQGNSAPTGVSCGYPRVRDWLGAGQERVSHFQSISITSVMSYLKAAKAARKVLRERLKFATVRPTYDPRHPWGVHARTGDQHSPYGPHGTHTRLPFLWEFY